MLENVSIPIEDENEDKEFLICERLLEFDQNDKVGNITLNDLDLFISSNTAYLNESHILVAFNTCPQNVIQILLKYYLQSDLLPSSHSLLYKAFDASETAAMLALLSFHIKYTEADVVYAVVNQRINHAICLLSDAVINHKMDCTFVYSLLFGYFHQADQSMRLLNMLCVLRVQPTEQFLMLCVKNHKLLWLQTIFAHFEASECIELFLIHLMKTEFKVSVENQVFCEYLAASIHHFEPEVVLTCEEMKQVSNHLFAESMYKRYRQVQQSQSWGGTRWLWDIVPKLYTFSHSILLQIWKLFFNKQM